MPAAMLPRGGSAHGGMPTLMCQQHIITLPNREVNCFPICSMFALEAKEAPHHCGLTSQALHPPTLA